MPSTRELFAHVQAAVAEFNRHLGDRLVLAPEIEAGRLPRWSLDHEIRIAAQETPETAGVIFNRRDGETTPFYDHKAKRYLGGRIHLTAAGMYNKPEVVGTTVQHELGHALGLDHYDRLFTERTDKPAGEQLMHADGGVARSLGAGDIRGLKLVAGLLDPAESQETKAKAPATAREMVDLTVPGKVEPSPVVRAEEREDRG